MSKPLIITSLPPMTLHRIGPFTLDTRTMLLRREADIAKVPMKTVEVRRLQSRSNVSP